MTRLFDFMDEFMDFATQTEEWNNILTNSSQMKNAERDLNAVLKRLKSLIPKELYMELSDKISSVQAVQGDLGILYGIKINGMIQEAAINPVAYSKHVGERMTQINA